MAHEATGLGDFSISTKHMRQLPAMDRRSWKQKRGISTPATAQAYRSDDDVSERRRQKKITPPQ